MRNKSIVKSLLAMVILGTVPSWAQAQVNGFTAANIGNNVGGSSTYNSSTQIYTVVAGGLDIEGTSDNFHYLYTSLSGQGRVIARIDSVTNTHDWTKVGVMVRQSTAPDAANAMFFLRPQLGSAGQYRDSTGAATVSTWRDTLTVDEKKNENFTQTNLYRTRYLRPAKWLSAVRQGNTVTTYSSDDGKCWNLRTKEAINLSGSVLIGVALTSNHSTNKATAKISGLSVFSSVPTDINFECQRAQIDGDLPKPTTWKVSPDDAAWSATIYNPNPAAEPRTCIAGGNPFQRADSPESPLCPVEVTTSPWAANLGLSDSGWALNQRPRDVVPAKTIWLRTKVNLTSSEKSSLMFWGKWSNSVSIYVNGQLATNTYRSVFSNDYHYLGLNDTARSALNVGPNLIAVRIDCFADEETIGMAANEELHKPTTCNSAAADFGITTNSDLAQLNVDANPASGATTVAGKKAEIFTRITKEQAAIGGVFAASKDGVLVDNRAIGYKDKRMLSSMTRDSILRLASVDKRVTDAVIVYLYEKGILRPNDWVFRGPDSQRNLNFVALPNVQPIGSAWGQHVEKITIEHLRTHTSGLTMANGWQGWQDEMAFWLGKRIDQITSQDLARIYATKDACDWPHTDCGLGLEPGDQEQYNSNAYALLRYIAQVKTGKSFNQILNDMATEANLSLSKIVVSSENVGSPARPSNEGYRTINRETRARWFELDYYLALSASAKGLLEFSNYFGPAFNMDLTPKAGGQAGGSDGSRAYLHTDPNTGTGHAYIWNSDIASDRRMHYLWSLNVDNRVAGSCSPTSSGAATKKHRLQNIGQDTTFVHFKNGALGLGPVTTYWEEAKWYLEPIDGTYYRIRSAWANHSDKHLAVTGTGNTQAVTMLAINPQNPAPFGAQWKVVRVDNYFRLENRAGAGGFLNNQYGALRIDPLPQGWTSTGWYICE